MRRILPIACVAFAFTVGLSAQTTGTGSSTQGTMSSKSSKAGKSSGRTVTLTGCLQQGDTPGTYRLTNVDMSGMHAKSGKASKAPSGTATSGGSTSGSESSMGNSGTVTLEAGGTVDLSKHVGHKVQVTGNWAEAGAGTSGTSGSSTAQPGSSASSGSASGNDMNSKSLNVKSLKHISESCQ